jgi:hypothetical protein
MRSLHSQIFGSIKASGQRGRGNFVRATENTPKSLGRNSPLTEDFCKRRETKLRNATLHGTKNSRTAMHGKYALRATGRPWITIGLVFPGY